MTKQKKSIVVGFVLIAGLVQYQAGCIYVSRSDKLIYGQNVASLVGPAQSSKPIRIGQTTRSQVLARLGVGQRTLANNQLAYTGREEIRDGSWVGFCADFMNRGKPFPRDADIDHTAVLEFDDHDVLDHFQID
jgi:hypothetical protein